MADTQPISNTGCAMDYVRQIPWAWKQDPQLAWVDYLKLRDALDLIRNGNRIPAMVDCYGVKMPGSLQGEWAKIAADALDSTPP